MQNELYFKTNGNKVYYYNHTLAGDDSEPNLYSFTIEDGKMTSKIALDRQVNSIISYDDINNGIFYNKTVFDVMTESDKTISCYYNGKVKEFDDIPPLKMAYYTNDAVYFISDSESEANTYCLYQFKAEKLTLIDKNISIPLQANNKIYYLKKGEIYENQKLIADNVSAIVGDLLDVNY